MDKTKRIKITDEQKIQVKFNLEKILEYYGAKKGLHNWQCIPNRHKTPNYDLSVKNNICCCHCGLQGDAFNVIAEIENLNIKTNFYEIITKGIEIIGSSILNDRAAIKKYRKCAKTYNKIISDNKYNLTQIIMNNYKNIKNNYVYFYKRNIKNPQIFSKYRIIIANPKKIFPSELLPNLDNIWAYQNIIPVWEERQVVNCILRRDDYLNKKNNKILNLKNLSLKIFNLGYLKHSMPNDIIFITEGIFDALTYENMNFKSIALNSVVMVNRFLVAVEENSYQLKENKIKFVIAMDNDEAGQKAKNNLNIGIKKIGLMCYPIKFHYYKDSNEFYQKASKNFYLQIKKIMGDLKNV